MEERALLRSIIKTNVILETKDCIGKTILDVLESDLNAIRGEYIIFTDLSIKPSFQFEDRDRAVHELSRYCLDPDSRHNPKLGTLGMRLEELGIIDSSALIEYWTKYYKI